jgi:hypothetical protein
MICTRCHNLIHACSHLPLRFGPNGEGFLVEMIHRGGTSAADDVMGSDIGHLTRDHTADAVFPPLLTVAILSLSMSMQIR